MAIIKYLVEQLKRKPTIIPLYYDSGFGEFDPDTLEDNMIDGDEIISQIGKVISKSGITPGRTKDIKYVLYDVSNGDVAGILYDSIDGDTYSFDIAVNNEYQGMGYATKLVDMAIREYNDALDAYDDLKLIADVVNPKMESILSKKHFVVIDNKPGHTYMQYKKN